MLNISQNIKPINELKIGENKEKEKFSFLSYFYKWKDKYKFEIKFTWRF